MNQQEMIDHLREGPVQHRINPDGKLQVLDLTSLPGAWRALFNDGGFFIGGDKPTEKPAEVAEVGDPGAASHSEADTEAEVKEEAKDLDPKIDPALEQPAAKQGKLPEGFPGLAALDSAGIHTFAQVRNAGDLTKIDGIAEATATKIQEALKA